MKQWLEEYKTELVSMSKSALPDAIATWAKRGRMDVVEAMLLSGVSPNIVSKIDGETALTAAVKARQKKIIKVLIEAGSNVNQTNNDKVSPLMAAVSDNNLEIAELLLEAGADVNYIRQTEYKEQSVMHCSVKFGSVPMLSLLKEHGALLNVISSGQNLVMEAVKHGHIKVLKWLMDGGADINFRDEKGKTAMYFAQKRRDEEVEELLKEAGAVPYSEEELKDTHYYIIYDDDKMYREVMTPWMNRVYKVRDDKWNQAVNQKMKECSSEKADNKESQKIIEALENEDICFLRAQIQKGDLLLEKPICNYDTPLVFGVRENKFELVRLLLSYGAKIIEGYKIEQSPIYYAVVNRNTRILKVIFDAVVTDTAMELGMIPHGFGFGEWDNMWQGELFYTYQHWDVEEKESGFLRIRHTIGMSESDELTGHNFIERLSEKLRGYGFLIWANDYGTDWIGNLDIKQYTITYVLEESKFDLVSYYSLYTYDNDNSCEQAKDILKCWDNIYGITFECINHYEAALKFTNKPENIDKFLEEVYELCPRLKESETREKVIKNFEVTGRLELKWN